MGIAVSDGSRIARQGRAEVPLSEELKEAAQLSIEKGNGRTGASVTVDGFATKRSANGQMLKLRQWANRELDVSVTGKVFETDEGYFEIEFRTTPRREVSAEAIAARTEKANATRAAKKAQFSDE